MANSFSSTTFQNTNQFLKLTETNYLAWLRQMKPFLNGSDLMGYVDGTIPAPAQTLSSSDSTTAAPAPNPAYKLWFKTEQQIISILVSSLNESINRLTIGCNTSKDIWDCLATHFNQQSVASATSLKFQILDLKKGNQSVDAYLQHAKSISDSLAAIDQPISDEDLVVAALHGLGSDYAMLCTALSTHKLPSFSDLRARILAFDAQNNTSSTADLPTAFFTSGGSSDPSIRPPNRSHQFTNGSGNWNNNNKGKNKGNWNKNKRYNNWRPSLPGPPWNNPYYNNGILGSGPRWCSNCQTQQHGQNQCPHRFSGPSSHPAFAGSHTFGDSTWFPDTGATHHMTAMPLQKPQPYSGPHNVYMGNGDSMPITHTGPF